MSGPTLVRDVMRPPVLALEGMWFLELVRLLRDRDADFVTVVNAEGRAVGAVTEEDLLLKLALAAKRLQRSRAGEAARLWRAQAMLVLEQKKSRYYDAERIEGGSGPDRRPSFLQRARASRATWPQDLRRPPPRDTGS